MMDRWRVGLIVATSGVFGVACQSDRCGSSSPPTLGGGSALSEVSSTPQSFAATWRSDSVSGVAYQPATGATIVTFHTSPLQAVAPAADDCPTDTVPVQLDLKTADGALAESLPATYSPDDGVIAARFDATDLRGTFSIANPEPGLKLDFWIWRDGSGFFGGSLPFVPDPNLPPGTITGTGTGFTALIW